MTKFFQKKIVQLFKRQSFRIVCITLLSVLVIFTFIKSLLPHSDKLFKTPHSTIILDYSDELLYAVTADDGQWRFPQCDTVPEKFAKCIIQFEDARFYWHFGVDVLSLARAFYNNIKAQKIINGGSTITMQVVRLWLNNKKRTYWQKFIEILYATAFEIKYTKSQILSIYASYAPFGRNIVGIEAASWLYYKVSPNNLSWGQAATLAVLPNSPALVYPGKNDSLLLAKRNKLLLKLLIKKIITSDEYQHAINEPLPGYPQNLPQQALHLFNRSVADGYKGKRLKTSIHSDLQELVQYKVNLYAQNLQQMKIYNVAAIVVDVQTNEVIAYVGNRTDTKDYDSEVDVINSPRSPGSLLKPLLYCASLSEGLIMPNSLLPDIPTFFEGFHPQNFNRKYEGAVNASFALSRSLNVPAVHLLKKYSIEKFHYLLNSIGLTTINRPPSHYGLTMILGGVEIKLYEIVGVYASMARVLKNHVPHTNDNANVVMPTYVKNSTKQTPKTYPLPFSSAEIWFTFKAMTEVARKEEEQYWQYFSSKQIIAWKTGTSYGERDAWAVGITPKYVVGVWAGNTSGEGRPGLTGIEAASPLMFEIFDLLPKSKWFATPVDDMTTASICSNSGFKISDFCDKYSEELVPKNCLKAPKCPYHHIVNLDKSEKWRVNADCEQFSNIVPKKWFTLPPSMEYYYRKNNPTYTPLPPLRDDCKNVSTDNNFEIVYPTNQSSIYIINQKPNTGKIILQALHKRSDAILYWHLDNNFIGATQNNHNLEISPPEGRHILIVYDNYGQQKIVQFEILSKE